MGEVAKRRWRTLPFWTNWAYATSRPSTSPRRSPSASRATSSTSSSSTPGPRRSSPPSSWPSSTTRSTGNPTAAGHQPQLRLPRHHARGARRHRAGRAPRAVRTAATGPPLRAQHQRLPPAGDDPAQAVEDKILELGPENVSLVIAEPVQNAGGCFTPPADYWPRLREICDRHGVLLACDEVITAFGRLGYWTGAGDVRRGPRPADVRQGRDLGLHAARRGGVRRPRRQGHAARARPRCSSTARPGVATRSPARSRSRTCAVFDELGRARQRAAPTRPGSGSSSASLYDRHEIVGDVRGTGYFWALELVKDREHKVMFDDEESERLLRGFLSARLLELGMICRADDRDEPVIQLSPPLVADREVLGEIVDDPRPGARRGRQEDGDDLMGDGTDRRAARRDQGPRAAHRADTVRGAAGRRPRPPRARPGRGGGGGRIRRQRLQGGRCRDRRVGGRRLGRRGRGQGQGATGRRVRLLPRRT